MFPGCQPGNIFDKIVLIREGNIYAHIKIGK